MNLNTIIKNKKAATPAEVIADIVILGVIVLIMVIFFAFFVKSASEKANLDLNANQKILDIDYKLLFYLKTPVPGEKNHVFADLITHYFINKDKIYTEKLKQFYSLVIQPLSADGCTVFTIEKVSTNKKINTEKVVLGDCIPSFPDSTQTKLPFYGDEYIIVQLDASGDKGEAIPLLTTSIKAPSTNIPVPSSPASPGLPISSVSPLSSDMPSVITPSVLPGASASAPAPSSVERLRVMTFNIKAGSAKSSQLNNIIALIKEKNPDVVALQEVDRNTKRSGGKDQFEILKQALGMNGYFSKRINYDGGEYGIALLTKHSIAEQSAVVYSAYNEKAVYQKITINVNGKDIVLFNTHLEPENKEKRAVQLQELYDAARTESGSYAIIMGDLNDESSKISMFKQSFKNAYESGVTFPSTKQRLDYIFTN